MNHLFPDNVKRGDNPLRVSGQKMRKILQTIIGLPFLAEGFALLGAIGFFAHIHGHAHGQQSVIDEGLYLYKGFLFVTGRYVPFQDNGPWTNHMPLSFLIPGWVQAIFGEGIRTGRYYAIGVGLLLLLGVWLVSRRFGGGWVATLLVWTIALNVNLVKIFSQAVSQGLVAMMVIWTMVFVLGERRRLWQLVLGTMLAGAVLLTRLNLFPLLPLVIVYIIWQHGWRKGLIAGGAGILVVLIGHAFFWPDILKLWAKWLPAVFTPFLNDWRFQALVEPVWYPKLTIQAQIKSTVLSLQGHLLPLLGIMFAWLSWPNPSPPWRANTTEKTVYFLSTVFLVLLGIHAWASLGHNYCIYCLQAYITFFSLVGLILFAIAVNTWFRNRSLERRLGIVLVLLLVASTLGTTSLNGVANSLVVTQIPRMANMKLRPGTVDMAVFIEGKLGIPFDMTLQGVKAGLFILVVLMIFSIVSLIVRKLRRRPEGNYSKVLFSIFSITTFLWVLVQGIIIGNNFQTYDCGEDIIQSYETVGNYLREKLPEDALVYWLGGRSPVPLLYLPDVKIFPPQLNGVYTLYRGGSPEELLRFGYWNQELAEDWLEAADYVLVEKNLFSSELTVTLSPEKYDEITPSPMTVACRPDSVIHIYRRIQ